MSYRERVTAAAESMAARLNPPPMPVDVVAVRARLLQRRHDLDAIAQEGGPDAAKAEYAAICVRARLLLLQEAEHA